MKLNIEFFKDSFLEAIGAGVYEAEIVYNNGKTKSVYIGESIFVLTRCATHLFELKKFPRYWGFTDKTIDDENITLRLHILQFPDGKNKECKAHRKEFEVEQIKLKKPTSQSGRADYLRDVEERINELNKFILEAKL